MHVLLQPATPVKSPFPSNSFTTPAAASLQSHRHAVAAATSAVDGCVEQGDRVAVIAAVAAFAECWRSQSENLQEAHAGIYLSSS